MHTPRDRGLAHRRTVPPPARSQAAAPTGRDCMELFAGKFLFSVADHRQLQAQLQGAGSHCPTAHEASEHSRSRSWVPLSSVTKAMNFSGVSLGFYNDPCEIPGRFLLMKSVCVCFLFLGPVYRCWRKDVRSPLLHPRVRQAWVCLSASARLLCDLGEVSYTL